MEKVRRLQFFDHDSISPARHMRPPLLSVAVCESVLVLTANVIHVQRLKCEFL